MRIRASDGRVVTPESRGNRFVFRDDEKVEVLADGDEKFCLAVGETKTVTLHGPWPSGACVEVSGMNVPTTVHVLPETDDEVVAGRRIDHRSDENCPTASPSVAE